MLKFNSLYELNEFINSTYMDIDIKEVDVKEFIVKTDDEEFVLFETPASVTYYPAYIIFNDELSYNSFYQKYKDRVTHVLSSVKTIYCDVTLNEFINLRDDYNIKYIELVDVDAVEEVNSIDYTNTHLFMSWSFYFANIPYAWVRGYTGDGIKIGIIDTIFDTFPGKLEFEDIIDYKVIEDWSYHHGTCVASVIGSTNYLGGAIGVAHNAKLYGIETLTHDGKLSKNAVNLGLDWCLMNNMDIINMSFASDSYSTTRKNLIDEIHDDGIIAVASAGNTGGDDGPLLYPAAFNTVVSVGGVRYDDNDNLIKASINYFNDSSIDLLAGARYIYTINKSGQLISSTGTSFASPTIAGFFALLKEEFPNKTKQQLLDLMQSNSVTVDGMYGVFPIYKDYYKTHNSMIYRVSGDMIGIKKIQTKIGSSIKTINRVQTKVGSLIIDIDI